MSSDFSPGAANAAIRARLASSHLDAGIEVRTVIDLSALLHAARLQPTTVHVGAIARLDPQMRVGVRTATDALAWAPGQLLVAEITGPGLAEVRAFDAGRQGPAQSALRLDVQGRVTLPPCVRAALGLVPGDQVLLIAQPEHGRVEVRSAAYALAEMTGSLAAASEPISADEPAATARGPRRAWRPQAG